MLFNEPKLLKCGQLVVEYRRGFGFSALQRAEIAEIQEYESAGRDHRRVSVLFNEPKLLKSGWRRSCILQLTSFSALQRAEIAEMSSAR